MISREDVILGGCGVLTLGCRHCKRQRFTTLTSPQGQGLQGSDPTWRFIGLSCCLYLVLSHY